MGLELTCCKSNTFKNTVVFEKLKITVHKIGNRGYKARDNSRWQSGKAQPQLKAKGKKTIKFTDKKP